MRISFPLSDLAVYDEKRSACVLPGGDYVVFAGVSSGDASPAAILRLDAEAITRRVKVCAGDPGFKDIVPQSGNSLCGSALPVIIISSGDIPCETCSYDKEPISPDAAPRVCWQNVLAKKATVRDFVRGLTNDELSLICAGRHEEGGDPGNMIGSAAYTVAGAAGETTKALEELGMPAAVMADGPAGLRLSTRYRIDGSRRVGLDNPLAGLMKYLDDDSRAKASAMAAAQQNGDGQIHYVYCTAIPIGTAIAQSFSDEMAQALGDMVGAEMERFGVQLWLAPAMNIQRSPLCGRNFEYYSEDPCLTGNIAAAMTKGVQKHPGCGVTVKHFTCNNQETNRTRSDSRLSERALREIYLRGFEKCVRAADPAAVMSSYNLVNGVHTCSHGGLLTDILRDEWGYEGFVMTDWFAANDFMPPVPGTVNPGTTPDACVAAGNDLIMPGLKSDTRAMTSAIDEGRMTRADLLRCAERVARGVLRLTAIAP